MEFLRADTGGGRHGAPRPHARNPPDVAGHRDRDLGAPRPDRVAQLTRLQGDGHYHEAYERVAGRGASASTLTRLRMDLTGPGVVLGPRSQRNWSTCCTGPPLRVKSTSL